MNSNNGSSQLNRTLPPTFTGTPPSEGFISRPSPPNYDNGRRILVSAVLSLVFVIALVATLHLYARYILRGRHRYAGSAPAWSSVFILRATSQPEQQQQQPRQGLDPASIARIHKFSYKSPRGEGVAPAECSICLSGVDEGEPVRVLPRCKHVFHVDCIDMWLHSHATCPVCRASAEPTVEGQGSSTVVASMSTRLSSSFRRMMSGRERSDGRVHSEGAAVDDSERQQNGA